MPITAPQTNKLRIYNILHGQPELYAFAVRGLGMGMQFVCGIDTDLSVTLWVTVGLGWECLL